MCEPSGVVACKAVANGVAKKELFLVKRDDSRIVQSVYVMRMWNSDV